MHHPKVIGLENALKNLPNRSRQMVDLVARIPLPLAAQSHIDQNFNLAQREKEVKMACIDLKGLQHAAVNDAQGLEA